MYEMETYNYGFDQFTNMENLQMKVGSYGAVLQYKDKVLMADLIWKGFVAVVYEFADAEKGDKNLFKEMDILECPLKLLKVSDKVFNDGGQAIGWCLEQVK